jgi:hypothetical protein
MSWGFVVLLAVAAVLYAAMAANVLSVDSSDAAGNGMAGAFAAIFGLALWIEVLVLLLMVRHGMPDWAAIGVFILLPVAPIVSVVAVIREWPRLLPALLPLPFLAIAVWERVA